GVVGLKPDRLAVGGNALVPLSLLLQGDTKVAVGPGVVGLKPDRLAVGGDGLVMLLLQVQGIAEVSVRLSIVGPKPDRFARSGDRRIQHLASLLRSAPVLQHVAEYGQMEPILRP